MQNTSKPTYTTVTVDPPPFSFVLLRIHNPMNRQKVTSPTITVSTFDFKRSVHYQLHVETRSLIRPSPCDIRRKSTIVPIYRTVVWSVDISGDSSNTRTRGSLIGERDRKPRPDYIFFHISCGKTVANDPRTAPQSLRVISLRQWSRSMKSLRKNLICRSRVAWPITCVMFDQ